MQKLTYYLFLLFINSFGRLPFGVVYGFGKGIKFLLKRVFGYRNKVIDQNLEITFPEKSDAEKAEIKDGFYDYLSRVVVEGLKQWKMSKEEILARCTIRNPEIFTPYVQQKKSIICVAAHYNNWEWAAPSTSLQLDHHIIGVYKALKNPHINERLLRLREISGIEFVDVKDTYKVIEKYEREGIPCMYVLLADQSPAYLDKSIWVDFFGHQTPTIKGPETLAKKYNFPILYGESVLVKKGYYELVFHKLCDDPQTVAPKEITQKFLNHVERQIRANPANWLWSHRRWKRIPEGVAVVE